MGRIARGGRDTRDDAEVTVLGGRRTAAGAFSAALRAGEKPIFIAPAGQALTLRTQEHGHASR